MYDTDAMGGEGTQSHAFSLARHVGILLNTDDLIF